MNYVEPDLSNKIRQPAPEPVSLPASQRAGKDDPQNYLPDSGLVDAFRAMILLRRPLLLTGEPGTGKTQAAQYLQWKLGYPGSPLRFDSKSTSTARDLFYTYDTIGRFHEAQLERTAGDPAQFIQYNALGAAILRALPENQVLPWASPGFVHPGAPSQSVVLIDEVDKAPRDFPNDVLNELENLTFRVPELKNHEFRAQAEFQPLVLITSNSEKNLPAAFLRRCLYYHIQKPGPKRFRMILEARLGTPVSSNLNDDALSLVMYLRRPDVAIAKKPATAELIDFVLLLLALGAKPTNHFEDILPTVQSALVTLLKGDDVSTSTLLEQWKTRREPLADADSAL